MAGFIPAINEEESFFRRVNVRQREEGGKCLVISLRNSEISVKHAANNLQYFGGDFEQCANP